jgi:hypothetical protein
MRDWISLNTPLHLASRMRTERQQFRPVALNQFALAMMRDIRTKLKLTVNETKTRACKLPEERSDFLGYTFGRCYSLKTGRAYIGTVPSKKRVIRICEAISEMTGRKHTLLDQELVVAKLNRTMIGWANYFCLRPVSKAYRAVESHACKRLRQLVWRPTPQSPSPEAFLRPGATTQVLHLTQGQPL